MRRILLAITFFAIASGAAYAEDAGAPAAAAPTPAVDSHLAAALDLLDANNSMSSVTNMLDALLPLEAAEIKRSHPNIDDAALAAIQAIVRNAIVAHEDEYKKIVATVYEEHFSEQELHTLAAFYRSDVGKKYIATMPSLIKEFVPVGGAWAQRVAGDALQKALMRLKTEGEHT
ncbi:MAG TPA: DUF2059 domain-containing protein [Rhizomicrobium sp.]|jgi:hypothetical protein